MSESVELAPQVTLEDDTLTVTVERQIASFGDHTTVRAHVSTGFKPAGEDESVEQYQNRIRGAVNTLATPLKVAVLTEIGRDFEVVDGIVLEVLDVASVGDGDNVPRDYQRDLSPRRNYVEGDTEQAVTYALPRVTIPVKEWVAQGGRNVLVPMAGAPAWVQTEASKYDWAKEVIHGQRNDGKGDYFKVSDGQRGGKSEFINPPKAGDRVPYPVSDNEPF